MNKIIQFGEGNFLRSFADLFFDTLNKEFKNEYEVYIVKPIKFGSIENFKKQNNVYHVIRRGCENGNVVEKVDKVECVKEVIDLSSEKERFYSLAKDPEVKILVSNTTEAGICFEKCNMNDNLLDISYPAKLTLWLYTRYKAGLKGIYLLPIELIENNAEALHECVDKYITLWNLDEDFRKWNDNENFYCNTLVDRIVSGHARDEETQKRIDTLIGENDLLSSICEPFGLWVIQNKGELSSLIPCGKHNIDVLLVNDISYYKKRKVRVLNGSHTNLVPVSLWMGKETVYDVMKDSILSKFVEDTLNNEIIPFVDKDINKTIEFSNSVKDRFLNPFLNHQLTSIALNSLSKWRARCLPSFLDYYNNKNDLPKYLTIGFAYLIHLYKSIEVSGETCTVKLPTRTITIQDDIKMIEFIKNNSVKEILANENLWGIDLSKIDNLENTISSLLKVVRDGGSLL